MYLCTIWVSVFKLRCSCIWVKTSYLPWGSHTLPEAEVNYSEDKKEAEHQLPTNTPNISQTRRLVDFKNVPPVERKHHISSSCQQTRQEGFVDKNNQLGNITVRAIYTYVVPVTHTYMHLRVKFLCRRPGGICPSHVIHAKVVGAVGGVPDIITVCPGEDAGEGGVEVEQGPGDDGVVVEGHV